MFEFLKRPLCNIHDDTNHEVSSLYEQINDLENEVNKLNDIIKNIENKTVNSNVAIDFYRMNAFSIERIMKGNMPTTVIGYIVDSDSDRKTKEWFFYCNEENHDKLVQEFNQYKVNDS